MGLIGNMSVLNKSLARFTSGTATAGAYAGQTRANFEGPSILRSRDMSMPQRQSFPVGYGFGTALIIPLKYGAPGALTTVYGEGNVTGSLLTVKTMADTMTGVGTINSATLQVLAKSIAALVGSGVISNAQLRTVSRLLASLSGTGTISANLSAAIKINAALSASASMSPNLKGKGSLSADLLPFTELSPENLSLEILDQQLVESGLSVREALRLISAALAGKVSGAGTATVTIRNAVADSKDRIVATVDVNGNRTAITTDVT